MSFSEIIKDELLATKNKKCCILPLRYGELITETKDIEIQELKKLVKNPCCKKAFLKGVFLGSGCIVNPNSDYHFEVTTKLKSYANFVCQIMNEFSLSPKIIKRNSNYVVYIKESDQIAVLLAVLGANKALLEYENIRIGKSIKNDINRTVNCETANLTKIVEAAVKQQEAIAKLKKTNKFASLNDKLKEIANLRLKYPEDSLDELKEKCSYKISKSGVYHRLNKIVKLAEEESK